jgi:hypothetical protein
MKCKIHVYLLNALYSQELADVQHKGMESADNRKYQWEDEFRITSDVLDLEELRGVEFPLGGMLEDGTQFSVPVKEMYLVRIKSSDGPDVFVGASESMVDHIEIERSEGAKISIYLKDDEPYANPIPGIYIASKEFPKELIR